MRTEPTATQSALLRRRQWLQLAGIGMAGTLLLGPASILMAQPVTFPGVKAEPGGHKPTFLPSTDADAVAHSIAENLFWNEQLMEHAVFLTMLSPGPELATHRAELEKFKGTFAGRLEQTRGGALSSGSLVDFNRQSMDEAKRFADFKRKMRDDQISGKIHSLVWPTFADHIAREADYFSMRLKNLSAGHTEIDREAATEFWATIMGEHSDFIAHLLDPAEKALIDTSMKSAEKFRELDVAAEKDAPDYKGTLDATEKLLGFKVIAGKGIDAGQIKSIIHPTLADHVRREAIKAVDELKRTA
jgi:hypothetical protein